MWHESTSGRGSSDIASCMFHYLSALPQDVKRVSMFSDTCAGQNRNINFSVMCLRAVRLLHVGPRLESGHSQMECDSVHSVIENACKKTDIYSPHDISKLWKWHVVMAIRMWLNRWLWKILLITGWLQILT